MACVTGLSAPVRTNNDLEDIIRWLKDGNCVVLHVNNKCERIFHKCIKSASGAIVDSSLDDIKVIYINAAGHQVLLDADEWPQDIEKSACKQCTCNVAKLLSDIENGKNCKSFYSFSL